MTAARRGPLRKAKRRFRNVKRMARFGFAQTDLPGRKLWP